MKNGMAMRLGMLCLCAFAVFPSTVFAQREIFKGQKRIIEGLGLSYQLRLDEAFEVFSKLGNEFPGSPAALFYPAAVKWGDIESFARWRRIALLHSITHPSKRIMREYKIFIKNMRDVINRCEELLGENPDDFEAMFYQAGAYGFIARTEFYHGHYLSAFIDGRKSAKYFDSLLETYPDKGDAMLGPGVYRYYVGSLSAPVRFLIFLLGLKGNGEEGLALIKKAHTTAVLSSIESADFLALFYGQHERNSKRGLHWADVLERLSPGSPLADYHRLLIFHNIGNHDKEEKTAWRMLEKSGNLSPDLKREWVPLLYFTLGAIKEEKREPKEAQILFKKAFGMPELDRWLKREIRLWLNDGVIEKGVLP